MTECEKLNRFLNIVPAARWRSARVPSVWSDQLRAALNDNLVTIGFAGVIKLTDAGYAALKTAQGKQE